MTITFGELRASGVNEVRIYCRDLIHTHHVTLSADRWPNRQAVGHRARLRLQRQRQARRGRAAEVSITGNGCS
jgi:hypothetical protein